MKDIMALLACLVAVSASTMAAAPLTNFTSTYRGLTIDRSSTTVGGGKATLSIGPLQRTGDIFTGDYHMAVSPYFFKSEKGRLSIVVSSEALAKVTNGTTAEITGKATTNGKGGQTRRIDAIATPADNQRGALRLWFLSGGRKVTFNTSYRFVEK